ncbi:fungal hydrophobin, partial [Ramicandelaber brevisporus]
FAAAAVLAQGACNEGIPYCCQTVGRASSPAVSSLLGLLGIVVSGDTSVGLSCRPLSINDQCESAPACCTGNNFSGLVTIGCTSVNVPI